MTNDPKANEPERKYDNDLDWLINTLISQPIDARAIYVANAIQAGTPQHPMPVSPSAHKAYEKSHKRIKQLLEALIKQKETEARIDELKHIVDDFWEDGPDSALTIDERIKELQNASKE